MLLVLSLKSCVCADARPAGPTRPWVPSAVTTPPELDGVWLTGAGGLAESSPPPPPHPATAIAPARRTVGTAALISLRNRCSEPSMPRCSSVIGLPFLSGSRHVRPSVHGSSGEPRLDELLRAALDRGRQHARK